MLSNEIKEKITKNMEELKVLMLGSSDDTLNLNMNFHLTLVDANDERIEATKEMIDKHDCDNPDCGIDIIRPFFKNTYDEFQILKTVPKEDENEYFDFRNNLSLMIVEANRNKQDIPMN